jgi:PIN domain nuclease of toxin-antitoxin system
VAVSVVSLFEIGQKTRLGKWPEMAPFVNRLIPMAHEQGGRLLALTAEASLLASTLDWAHRDPFDRFLGATAIMEGLSLVSADFCFDSLAGRPGWTNRIW